MAIASFAALATVNFTTVLAGMLIVSPVAGLRPMRALRFTSFSFPTPGNVKAPVDLVLEIAKSARLASRWVCLLLRETVRQLQLRRSVISSMVCLTYRY
ncbi:MAG: hypothetical protein CM1200mP29_02710 [Verrucomicrobiota bacterium]|nr:MAG: hypothetical protein CM1200mP29_02710 [Verrucomicrobiota bacterium]